MTAYQFACQQYFEEWFTDCVLLTKNFLDKIHIVELQESFNEYVGIHLGDDWDMDIHYEDMISGLRYFYKIETDDTFIFNGLKLK